MKNLFSDAVLSLWGKKEAKNDQYYWLPLVAHLIDTRYVITYLYDHYLCESQRQLIGLNKSIVGFLGYIHDLGKATPAFQAKSAIPKNRQLDAAIKQKQADFSVNDLFDPLATPHNLAGEYLLEHNHLLNSSFGAIIGAHHGKPFKKIEIISNYQSYPENYGLAPIWPQMRQEIIDFGLLNLSDSDQQILQNKELTQTQAILLTGLVIMADWLASNTAYFPLIEINKSFIDLNFKARFKQGIKKWQKEDQWEPNDITDLTGYFKKHFGFSPNSLQIAVLQTLLNIKKPGLAIIEAPMGIGKTEIALTVGEAFSKKNQKSGLYYALPTQATANGMLPRFANWLKQEKGTKGLKLLHSKAQFDQDYQALLDNDTNVIQNAFYSGKLGILEPFGIGTIDQLLSMGLKQRHLFLKHLAFSGKTIIIDEVHSFDSYMDAYLARVLSWLGAYKVPVIALSATLPLGKRQNLVRAYLNKSDIQLNHDLSYPLITYTDGEQVYSQNSFDKLKDKIIQIKHLSDDSPSGIALKADSLVKNGGVCGIVVNSIKRAQLIAQSVSAPFLVLHSAFLAKDRNLIEKRLQKAIGKDGIRPQKLVVIGTQVLEQSLDIDFDVLITDLAPMDLLLQRIGRLWRHDIDRPRFLGKPVCYIAYQKDSKSFKTDIYLYGSYLISQTLKYLPDKIVLPTDIAKLVQQTYQIDTHDFLAKKYLTKQQLEIQKAQEFQIALPASDYKSIHNWLDNSMIGNNEKAMQRVRDTHFGLESILQFDNESLEELLEQTIRLPLSVSNALKGHERQWFNQKWQQNKYLKNKIYLKMQNKQIEISNFSLKYDNKLGLIYNKSL